MSPVQYRRLIRRLGNIGVTKICFTGGEPLLEPQLFDYIELANRWNIQIQLFTNGNLLTEKKAKKLAQYNIGLIQISFRDAREEVHDKMTGNPGFFRKSVIGIQNGLCVGLPIVIMISLGTDNVDNIYNTVGFLKQPGVKRFVLGRLNLCSRADSKNYQDSILLVKQFATGFKEIANMFSQKNSSLSWINPGPRCTIDITKAGFIHKCDLCDSPDAMFSLTICVDGNVMSCRSSQRVIGNVLSDDIVALWLCQIERKKHNKEFATGRYQHCEYIDRCPVICRKNPLIIRDFNFQEFE